MTYTDPWTVDEDNALAALVRYTPGKKTWTSWARSPASKTRTRILSGTEESNYFQKSKLGSGVVYMDSATATDVTTQREMRTSPSNHSGISRKFWDTSTSAKTSIHRA